MHCGGARNRRARPFYPSLIRLSRNALVTTDTELMAIAAPAKIGDSSRLPASYGFTNRTGASALWATTNTAGMISHCNNGERPIPYTVGISGA